MEKMEIEVVRPLKPSLYSRYADDIHNGRKKDEFDKVFHALNNYYENIKLTLEISPSKFLDTQLINEDGKYVTNVYRKESKIPIHWSSKIPKRYKRNTITTDLHRAGNIASDIKEEIQTTRKKFIKADYLRPFVNSVINQYNNKTKEQQLDNDDDYTIPPCLFEEENPFILLKLPFCEQNEVNTKDFIKTFHKFCNNNFRLAISWKTRKMQTLFKIKDKSLYPACKIYHGECEHCGDNYIRESIRSILTRWSGHNNPNHKSEPAEHMSGRT